MAITRRWHSLATLGMVADHIERRELCLVTHVSSISLNVYASLSRANERAYAMLRSSLFPEKENE